MFSFLSNYQIILVLAIMFLVLAWMLELFFLVKLSGNTKLGFKIWSKPLSSEAQEYLSNFAENIIEPHQIGWQAPVYSFIKVENNEVIIRPLRLTLIPCIAYVNLIKPNAKLEYRGGVSHFFVFLLAFAYAFYLVIPLFALMLVINYWVGIQVIDNYLNKKIRARRAI
ncbi:MAG: hypothetical protein MUO31_12780 [Thermodesulfovibrionales bacterium]|nr:hypothetical protein [Thermodesulfovibrionales bacterium]